MANISFLGRRSNTRSGCSDLDVEPQGLRNPYHPFLYLSPESSSNYHFSRSPPPTRRFRLGDHLVDEGLGSDQESVVSDHTLSDLLTPDARAPMEDFPCESPSSLLLPLPLFPEGAIPVSDHDGGSELDFDLLDGEVNHLEPGLELDLEPSAFVNSRFNEDDDVVDEDDYFIQQRFNFFDTESAISSIPPYPVAGDTGFELDLDSGEESGLGDWPIIPESDNLGINVQYYNDSSRGTSDDGEVSVGIPLRWDSLRLEDHDDYGWEEVADERDVLTVFVDEEVDAPEDLVISDDVALSPISRVLVSDDLVSVDESNASTIPGNDSMEVTIMGNINWEVFLNSSNMEFNDFVFQQNEFMGEILESETSLLEVRPAASNQAIQNLVTVVVTKEDAETEISLCAVCKDEISIGEQAKKLPCTHQYHGECIIPWLNIRNTCPVCRYELPTDDPEYERGRVARQRGGH